jgi:hypothetical protein
MPSITFSNLPSIFSSVGLPFEVVLKNYFYLRGIFHWHSICLLKTAVLNSSSQDVLILNTIWLGLGTFLTVRWGADFWKFLMLSSVHWRDIYSCFRDHTLPVLVFPKIPSQLLIFSWPAGISVISALDNALRTGLPWVWYCLLLFQH